METLFTAFLSSSSGMGESLSGENEWRRVDNMNVFGRFFLLKEAAFLDLKNLLRRSLKLKFSKSGY